MIGVHVSHSKLNDPNEARMEFFMILVGLVAKGRFAPNIRVFYKFTRYQAIKGIHKTWQRVHKRWENVVLLFQLYTEMFTYSSGLE